MQIMMIAEEIFCSKVSEDMREIRVTALVDLSIRNMDVVSNFNMLLEMCSEQIDRDIGMDILEQILTLFFKVRSFSFAKSVLEK